MNPAQRILIIDDDSQLGQMLGEFLANEGWQTEWVGDGQAGRDRAVSDEFDAIVLDVMLPSMNGFDVLRAIRAQSQVPVIMLTARGEDTDRIVGLELGADDYLAKPFNPRELGARLRAILRRTRTLSTENLIHGDLKLDRQARKVSLDGQPIQLTAAEFTILEQLLEHPGQVLSKDEISRHALGRELQPFDRSVDTHVSRLRGKLGPLPDGEPRIQSIRGRGYVLIRPAS